MQKTAIFALVALFVAPAARAQEYDIADPPLGIRWSVGFGPTVASPSSRTARLPGNSCFACTLTTEVVSGADQGAYHAALTAVGAPSRLGLALRLEVMFNHNTSDPYVAPAKTCAGLKCEQKRKAETDDAFMFTGAVDFVAWDSRVVSPYVTVGGGIEQNRLRWRQDSSTTSELSGKSSAFGPFVALGGGVRATFRTWAAFLEWRQFLTFVTPGSQMAPLSLGVQYRPKRSPKPAGT